MPKLDTTSSPNTVLLKSIKQGDETAFNQLFEKYWDQLFISAYKVLRNEEDAKDIVQEVLMEIWAGTQPAVIGNLDGYLHKVTRYKVLMKLRRGRVATRHLETISLIAANTTEEMVSFAELNDILERSVDSLPERCKEVFRMSRNENLSNTEISLKLNISVRTVETHISHALRHLRRSVDPSSISAILFIIGVDNW